MNIRTVKIWLSKGWYFAVYSVSLLLVTIITSCSSSKSSTKSNVSNDEAVANSNSQENTPIDNTFISFDSRDPYRMRLMYGVQPPENPRNATPLVVLDHNIAGIDKDRLIQFDFASGSSSKEQVATLLGVKSKKLMAYKILTGTDATSVWGMRAYYGILDVLSKKAYRKALKSGESLDGYQLLK